MQSASSDLRSLSHSDSFHTNAIDLPHPPTFSNSHESSLEPSSAPSLNRRRRKDRACDACRRRKTKCDGPFMPDNKCTTCIQSHKTCTYIEISKPRGPPKAYITSLEDRMEHLEALLEQIRPGVDFSGELGPPIIRDSWKFSNDTFASNERYQRSDLLRKRSLPVLPHESLASVVHIRGPLPSHLSLPSISGSRSPQVTTGIRRPRSRRSEPHLSALYFRGEISEYGSSGEDSLPDSDENLIVNGAYGVAKLTHVTSEKHEQKDLNGNRFHGRSSTMGLVEVTRQLKRMHMSEAMKSSSDMAHSVTPPMSSRRPEFWETPSWEQLYEGQHIESPTIIPSILEKFPPYDLAETLINLYFLHINTQFPLLHHPTFNRQWQEKLHHRDIWFAAVCLGLFSVASRWCDDPRVLPEGVKTECSDLDWSQAGWRYYEPAIGVHRLRRSLLYPATLFEIQTFTLLAMFIQGSQSYPSAWIFVNVGIRKAQDVGAHRKRVYHEKPNLEDELWKRAFWHLIVFDRLGSVGLGRAFGIQEEDFDLELPLEIDDEYWELQDTGRPFQQPIGVPSKISAFNQFIKLTQIMAFTVKTIYCIDRSKVFGSPFVGDWQEEVVSRLTNTLQKWMKEVPEHLRWSDNMRDPIFSSQAATIFTSYYLTEMLIYRPFIPNLGVSSSPIPQISYAPFDICIKAARASARIVKVQMERGLCDAPHLISVSNISAGLLLLKIWDMKIQEKTQNFNGSDIKPPLAYQIDDLTSEVKILVSMLEWVSPRWAVVQSYLGKIQELLPQPLKPVVSSQSRYATTQTSESRPQGQRSTSFSLKANQNVTDGRGSHNWGEYSVSSATNGMSTYRTVDPPSNPAPYLKRRPPHTVDPPSNLTPYLERHTSHPYAFTDDNTYSLQESHMRTSGIYHVSALREEYNWSNAMQYNFENGQPNGRSRTLSDASQAHQLTAHPIRRTSVPPLPARTPATTENSDRKLKGNAIIDAVPVTTENTRSRATTHYITPSTNYYRCRPQHPPAGP